MPDIALTLRTGAAPGVVLAFAALTLSACETAPSVAGTYTFESSSVVSSGTGTGPCRVPILPSDDFLGSYRVGAVTGGHAKVTELATGCTFAAEVEDDVVSAQDVECEIPADAPVREQWGLRRRRYVNFTLDSGRGLLRANLESWQELSSGDGHSCGAIEGRLVEHVEAQDLHGSWLNYAGTFRYFVEQPEGAPDCGNPFYYGQTSGFFGVTRNEESGATTLTWEGMGCELNVQGSDAGPFTATDAACRIADDAGIRRFGIERIHFDDFTFDPEASELTARGRFGRVVDGQRTSYCFEAPDGR